MVKILVTAGLPGSGKTTFALKKADIKFKDIDGKREKPYYNSKNRTIFLKLDSYMLSKKNNESTEDVYNYIFDRIKVKIQSLLENNCNVIIDGLFLNNEDYIHIAKTFKDYDIVFHWWEPLKEVCLHNDKYRRNKSCENLIKAAIFEEPDIVAIKMFSDNKCNIETVKHTPERKSSYQLFCDKFNLDDEIVSDKWSEGGEIKDCYDHTFKYEPEERPATFEILDDLLDKINDNINFRKYRNIIDECVVIVEEQEHDYYSSTLNYSKFVCRTDALFYKLRELELLPEEFNF